MKGPSILAAAAAVPVEATDADKVTGGQRSRRRPVATAAGRMSAPPRDGDKNVTAAAEERSAAAFEGSGVSRRLAEMSTSDLPALRAEWRRLLRRDPPRLSRDQMMRTLAYRIQEDAFGGLPQAVERRLAKLAVEFEAEGRITTPAPPRVKAGARLVREWHGRTHVVSVVDDGGFEYEGKTYPSLTAIAVEITGARWSGPRFFGLVRRKDAKEGEKGGDAGHDGEGPDSGEQVTPGKDPADV